MSSRYASTCSVPDDQHANQLISSSSSSLHVPHGHCQRLKLHSFLMATWLLRCQAASHSRRVETLSCSYSYSNLTDSQLTRLSTLFGTPYNFHGSNKPLKKQNFKNTKKKGRGEIHGCHKFQERNNYHWAFVLSDCRKSRICRHRAPQQRSNHCLQPEVKDIYRLSSRDFQLHVAIGLRNNFPDSAEAHFIHLLGKLARFHGCNLVADGTFQN